MTRVSELDRKEGRAQGRVLGESWRSLRRRNRQRGSPADAFSSAGGGGRLPLTAAGMNDATSVTRGACQLPVVDATPYVCCVSFPAPRGSRFAL